MIIKKRLMSLLGGCCNMGGGTMNGTVNAPMRLRWPIRDVNNDQRQLLLNDLEAGRLITIEGYGKEDELIFKEYREGDRRNSVFFSTIRRMTPNANVYTTYAAETNGGSRVIDIRRVSIDYHHKESCAEWNLENKLLMKTGF
jgi:hypothetical protein